ncbi:MAG: acyltransferase [Pseudomonadota bacterium]
MRVNHLHQLDLLRFLASVYVVIFHMNEPVVFNPSWWTTFCKFGYLGVPVFFVISGYCMALIENKSTPFRFLLARLARIYPPYLASLLVVFICVLGIKLVTGVNDAITLPQSIGSALMTGLMLVSPATSVQGINWVYWSLIVEVFFYIWFSICLTGQKLRLILLILPLFWINAVDWSLLVSGYSIKPLCWVIHYPVFLLGYALFRVLHYRSWWLFIVTAALSIYLNEVFKVGAIFLALVFIAFFRLPLNGSRFESVVSWGGSISYSLYLVHVPIACYVMIRFREEAIALGVFSHFLADLCIVVVTVCMARAFYLLIEKPSHQWSRLLSGKMKI